AGGVGELQLAGIALDDIEVGAAELRLQRAGGLAQDIGQAGPVLDGRRDGPWWERDGAGRRSSRFGAGGKQQQGHQYGRSGPVNHPNSPRPRGAASSGSLASVNP